MSNYEIMLILDPKSDEKIISDIAKSTFKSKEIEIKKMERTELAYEINKSKTAIYFLVNTKATGKEINEFTRKANIAKNVWRILSINLDSEKGLNRKAKPKRIRKPMNFVRKTIEKQNNVPEEMSEINKEEKVTTKKETTKKTGTKKELTKERKNPTKKATKKE